MIVAGVESPLRARPLRVRALNAAHLAVTIILLPGAPYHHSETSGRRAKVFKLSVWARIGSAFASRASAPLANSSGVRQLAAAFAQGSLLAVQRCAVLWPMRLRASSPEKAAASCRTPEPGYQLLYGVPSSEMRFEPLWTSTIPSAVCLGERGASSFCTCQVSFDAVKGSVGILPR